MMMDCFQRLWTMSCNFEMLLIPIVAVYQKVIKSRRFCARRSPLKNSRRVTEADLVALILKHRTSIVPYSAKTAANVIHVRALNNKNYDIRRATLPTSAIRAGVVGRFLLACCLQF
jgi:hypothetical protein